MASFSTCSAGKSGVVRTVPIRPIRSSACGALGLSTIDDARARARGWRFRLAPPQSAPLPTTAHKRSASGRRLRGVDGADDDQCRIVGTEPASPEVRADPPRRCAASTLRCPGCCVRKDAPVPYKRARKRDFGERACIFARLDDRRTDAPCAGRSTSSAGNVGCCAMSASQASASAKLRARRVDPQQGRVAPGLRRVARAELLDFLRDLLTALRVVVPSSSIPAAKSAAPGSAGSLAAQAGVDDQLRGDDRQSPSVADAAPSARWRA